jgi:hypothetical protein
MVVPGQVAAAAAAATGDLYEAEANLASHSLSELGTRVVVE